MEKMMKMKDRVVAWLMIVMISGAALFTTVPAMATAAGVDDMETLLGSSFGDKDVLQGVNDFAANMANSLRKLFLTIGIAMVVIGLIVTGMQFTSSDARKKDEAKGRLGRIILGAIIIVGASAILIFAGSLATTIATSLNGK